MGTDSDSRTERVRATGSSDRVEDKVSSSRQDRRQQDRDRPRSTCVGAGSPPVSTGRTHASQCRLTIRSGFPPVVQSGWRDGSKQAGLHGQWLGRAAERARSKGYMRGCGLSPASPAASTHPHVVSPFAADFRPWSKAFGGAASNTPVNVVSPSAKDFRPWSEADGETAPDISSTWRTVASRMIVP